MFARKTYFFKLDLLGGEPVWQVLHAFPFAIWGVACALDIVREFIAKVRKNMITVPITVVTIPVFVAGCIAPSNLCLLVANIDKLLEHSALTAGGQRVGLQSHAFVTEAVFPFALTRRR
jgi:hypothetical protein